MSKVTITRDMTIAEVLEANPKTADVLRGMGMHCLGCPSATGESVAGAARTHGMNVEILLENLNAVEYGEMSEETAQDTLPVGAIVQRDKKTFAVVPHIPAGLVSPGLLRKIADVAEKYKTAALKLTSGQRIAIVGLTKEDVPKIWEELGLDPGYAAGNFVRNVKVCPGTTFCKRGEQDAVGMGLELDKKYHGVDLPSKLKIAVSGCSNNCSEAPVRDVGLVGSATGWNLMIGGNVGPKRRIGQIIATGLDDERAKALVDKVIFHYRRNAKLNERLGAYIERVGIEEVKKAVLAE